MKIAIVIYFGSREDDVNRLPLLKCAEELGKCMNPDGNSEKEIWKIETDKEYMLPGDCEFHLQKLIEERTPDAVLIEGNYFGNELAVRLFEKVDGSCVLNVERFNDDEGNFAPIRRAYASNLFVKTCLNKRPLIFTIQEGAFPAEKNRDDIETIVVKIGDELPDYCISRRFISDKKEANRLENAKLVVAGGRGMGCRENTAKLEGLADILAAALGSSRPPVLDAWAPHSRLIGASGKKVRPKLCLAFGISGAGPFIAGVEKSDIIAAVNKDPDALIFKYCDYGIVGDCNEAADALHEVMHEERSVDEQS